METLRDRVIKQVQREYPVGDTGAECIVEGLKNSELLRYISQEIDDMFKEVVDVLNKS